MGSPPTGGVYSVGGSKRETAGSKRRPCSPLTAAAECFVYSAHAQTLSGCTKSSHQPVHAYPTATPTRPATSPPSGPTRLATHNSTPPGLPTHMHRRPTRPATNSRRAAPRNPAAASRPPTLAPTSGAVRGLLAGPAPPFPPPLTRRPHPAPTRPATKSRWWPPGRTWLAGRRVGLCFAACGCGRA